MKRKGLPKNIRVSVGSAVVLGLHDARLDARPTTIYMLTHKSGKCAASCAFCPQSKLSEGRSDLLSRVVWPIFDTVSVTQRVAEAFAQGGIKRVCIQALNYPEVQEDLVCYAREIRSLSDVPISISCQPLRRGDMLRLVEAGVSRVSIALDAATKELFEEVKGALIGGPYTWEGHIEALKEAGQVFGENHVTTHLMAGLGEKEEDLVAMIQRCVDLGVYPALFAFTPIPGTVMANRHPPSLEYYRRIQLAHYLITHKRTRFEDMKFTDNHLADFDLPTEELQGIIRTGEPFRTSGCPGCNRPYYNERPSGPIYNYPTKPASAEIVEIEKTLGF